jgi:hypothetical protein
MLEFWCVIEETGEVSKDPVVGVVDIEELDGDLSGQLLDVASGDVCLGWLG